MEVTLDQLKEDLKNRYNIECDMQQISKNEIKIRYAMRSLIVWYDPVYLNSIRLVSDAIYNFINDLKEV